MSEPPTNEAEPRPEGLRAGGVLWRGLIGSLLLWLAQPPAGLWPLAWVAPLAWLSIVADPRPLGRQGYLKVWLAGFVYWMLTVHWIRLPHPMTILGWPLLCAYIGCYLPAFVAVTRSAKRFGAPLWLAAPIAWTGLEYLQATLFSGFLMGAVSHSQAGVSTLLPIASYVGAYGVSFAVLLIAAVIHQVIEERFRLPSASTVVGAVAIGIGVAFLQSIDPSAPAEEKITIAIAQGDARANWDPDPGRNERIMDRQTALSLEAIAEAERQGKQIDLILWPESMFRPPLVTFDGSTKPPENLDPDYRFTIDSTKEWFVKLVQKLDAPLLVGLDRFDYPAEGVTEAWADVYNSAGLIGRSGELLATYDKTHLVPFGEYIPLAKGMPALYFLTPMAGGMARGDGAVAMRLPVDGRDDPIVLCPSICFETAVPHVIRRQVSDLTDRGQRPDLLVNVTNDAWFWGSSELDIHLACAVYRAVETGTPIVIAANGGLSALVDASGTVLAVGPRMEEHAMVVEAPLACDRPTTPYVEFGDWFARGCLWLVLLAAAAGAGAGDRWRRSRRLSAPLGAA